MLIVENGELVADATRIPLTDITRTELEVRQRGPFTRTARITLCMDAAELLFQSDYLDDARRFIGELDAARAAAAAAAARACSRSSPCLPSVPCRQSVNMCAYVRTAIKYSSKCASVCACGVACLCVFTVLLLAVDYCPPKKTWTPSPAPLPSGPAALAKMRICARKIKRKSSLYM